MSRALHGTRSRYNLGCRCESCTEANREYKRGNPLPKHGTRARYGAGCRCEACTFANARYMEAYRSGYRCVDCGKVCKNLSGLGVHRAKIHKVGSPRHEPVPGQIVELDLRRPENNRPAPGDDQTAWQTRGSCRGADPELFFLDRGAGDATAARAICEGCPVRRECLEYALGRWELTSEGSFVWRVEKYGIWGGRTEKERRKIRRDRSDAQAAFGELREQVG